MVGITDSWHIALNDGNSNRALFGDFRKAFDHVMLFGHVAKTRHLHEVAFHTVDRA